jgi:hypothetical protein
VSYKHISKNQKKLTFYQKNSINSRKLLFFNTLLNTQYKYAQTLLIHNYFFVLKNRIKVEIFFFGILSALQAPII